MAWVIIVIAGLLEVAWATMLPETQGLTRPAPTAAFLALLAGSMYLLAKATETIPVGTAYGVWVGIGAVGAAIAGVVIHNEPLTLWRSVFIALLVVAIVGLKVTGGAGHA